MPANRVKLLPAGPAPKPGLSQLPPAHPGSPHPAPENSNEDQEVRVGAPPTSPLCLQVGLCTSCCMNPAKPFWAVSPLVQGGGWKMSELLLGAYYPSLWPPLLTHQPVLIPQVYVVPPPARPCPTLVSPPGPCPPSPDPIYKVPRGSGTQLAVPGDALEVRARGPCLCWAGNRRLLGVGVRKMGSPLLSLRVTNSSSPGL